MHYRREIDGLRAVAVLPVILFHAGFTVFSGGYVGVDIFFVISGFLITSILIKDLESGQFSLIQFYERRARRILPALFFIMLACIPFAYLWMMPDQLKAFFKSIGAVLLFVSNFVFFRESGYFAADAELKPLLHTWSLAVEEQYYLIFPVFLLFTWRFGRSKVFWSVTAIAALSLLISEWGWRNAQSANFYLAPSRAWELLAGSICAFLTVGRTVKANNNLSLLGLAAILFSIFAYDETTPFPSLYTLVPVLGTALIILFGGAGTWVAKLLSLRGFVGIGLISYSAYLWHQPLFAFARLRSLTEPGPALMGLLALAALILAYGTWRWVEQPFRKGPHGLLPDRRGVFMASGMVGVALFAIGAAGYLAQGFPHRVAQDDRITADLDVRRWQDSCFDFDHRDIATARDWFCVKGATEDYSATVAVIGDSHALSHFAPLAEWGDQNRTRFLLNGVSACPPLIDIFVRRFTRQRDDCAARNAQIFTQDALQDVDAVILIARWTGYGFGDVSGYITQIARTYEVAEDRDASYETFLSGLSETLATLASHDIPTLILHQPPVQNISSKDAYAHSSLFGISFDDISADMSVRSDEYDSEYSELRSEIAQIAGHVPNALIWLVDPAPLLCDPVCQMAANGRAVYLDDDHLSNYGASLLTPGITRSLHSALSR